MTIIFEKQDINEIIRNGNFELINTLLADINLKEEQLDTIKNCLNSPTGKMIISDEMGLGKTYICIGLIRIAKLLYPDKKIIVSTPKNVIKNFEDLITNSLGLRCITTTGDRRDLSNLQSRYKEIDVIIAQHSFWTHIIGGSLLIYNRLEDFSMSFFDEAAFIESSGFEAFSEFSKSIPMSYLANATPIGENTELIYNLLYACGALPMTKASFGRRYSKEVIRNREIVGCTVFTDKITDDFKDYITVKNRSSIGLETSVNIEFHKIAPTPIQRKWMDDGMTKPYALYSPLTFKNYNGIVGFDRYCIAAVDKLLNILENSNEKTIVYVKNTSAIVSLRNIFSEMGYNPYIIDGKHTNTDELVKEQESLFNADPNGIMITNADKGINLGSSNRIIIYNNPPDLQQLIYRMIRGFVSKEVKVDWIYYVSYEEDSIKKILNKTKNVSNLLDRELDIINQLEEEVGKKTTGKFYDSRMEMVEEYLSQK